MICILWSQKSIHSIWIIITVPMETPSPLFKKISFSTWINDLGAFVGNAVNFCQTDKQDTMSIKWQSETCAVDVSMCGLWSTKLARDSDIHCVAVNPERSLVAVGDSRGQISLFRYPCFKQGVSDDNLVKESIVEH